MSAAESTELKSGNLGVTLATWVYILFTGGTTADDAGIVAACEALRDAEEGAALDRLGQDLVDAVLAAIGSDETDFDTVLACVQRLYGTEHVATDLGEPADRFERARGIRRVQFGRNHPWIALIIDRFPSGVVGAHWVMVEDLTESVKVMDPYPWDDVDEQYEIPLNDFMVKWELAGGQSIRYA
jgi:hypothetical protein